MEKETIIMQYIAVWNWHLLAMLFLVGSLLVVSFSRDFINLVFLVGLMIAFVICELIAYNKRGRMGELKGEDYE